MRKAKGAVFAILLLFVIPGLARAQGLGTIAGVVKDASGAVLQACRLKWQVRL